MKTIILASAALLIATSLLRAKDDSTITMWRALSANSQNLHYALHSVREGGIPDPSTHEEALKRIDDALNQLVAAEVLISKEIELTRPPTKDAKDWQPIFEIVHRISDEYGYYVASDMCDLGGRRAFEILKSGDTFKLHLRLPKKALEDFLAAAKPLIAKAK
jgi:hypothetical protein